MNTKQLYKNQIIQNINYADRNKDLLVSYKKQNAEDLTKTERNILRNEYLQLSDEINNSFYREKDAIHQLVCKMKPTHIQTITFCTNKFDKNYPESVCQKTLEVYLKKLNKKLFHRRTDIQLEVLPFKETSASQNIHFHLLLKNPQEHINNKKIDFEEICRSVLRTMKFVDKVNTSNPETLKELDFIKENYRNPTFYCLKESCQINDLPLVCDLMYYQR